MPKSKDKGKQRASEQEIARQLAEEDQSQQLAAQPQTPSSGFHLLACEVELPLAPAADLQETARKVLEQWVGKYVDSLGVVLCSMSWPLQFPEPSAHFIGNGSTVLLKVRFEGVGWRPVVGSRLIGRINSSSSAHVGVLLHSIFNATIEHFAIPSERYMYDEERIAPHVVYKKAKEAKEGEEGKDPQFDEFDSGCWVDRETGEPLGGEGCQLQFTVVGLTIASGLMTTLGSLLDDPLNPPNRDEGADIGKMSLAVPKEATEAIRAPSPKVVRFDIDTVSPPNRQPKKRKKKTADEAVDTSVDTEIEVPGDEDDSNLLESVEGVEEERPRKKKRLKEQ